MSFVHPLYEVGGVDLSYYQYPVDYDTLDPRISFQGARLGDPEINGMIDYTYVGYSLNARLRKKPRLAYWYWRPNFSNDSQLRALEPLVKDDWPEMGVYADTEFNPGISKSTLSAKLDEFLNGLDSMVPIGSGEIAGLYSGISFLNNNVDHKRIRLLEMRPKWLALVPVNIIYPPKPWAHPYGWPDIPDIWQFNWNGGALYGTPGKGREWGVSSRGLDLNVFCGTRREFELRFNIIPTGGQMEAIGFVASAKINMRPVPSDAFGIKVVGQLHPTGTTVPVYKTETDKKGRGLWYQISGDSQYEIWVASWVGGKTIYAS